MAQIEMNELKNEVTLSEDELTGVRGGLLLLTVQRCARRRRGSNRATTSSRSELRCTATTTSADFRAGQWPRRVRDRFAGPG